ncbi:MAG TPA: FAD-linked oxidase C-terminal domain-containing protein [Thermoleophilia bacterium]|nr:FAD-linked oxidase C-terminal domain-containing protein [Thermoleophilia bacterium]
MQPSRFVQELIDIVGERNVLWDDYDLRLYEYDGSVDRALPQAVVLPESAEQIAEIVKLCNRASVPYTARGGGTGLSGGSIPVAGGVLIALVKMNRVLEVDLDSLRAVVEPGLVNLQLSEAVAGNGLYYVPDPSSQKACTIGGNVGENSGGPHTLLYGVTTNHVLGVEVVMPDGELVEFGGKALDLPGYDLTGAFVGSEGTLGIATKITVRLVPLPEDIRTLLAVFDSVEDASATVSEVIGRGIIPAAIEMMDQLALQAVEASVHAGYPEDAAAVLLIEVDGLSDGLDEQAEAIREIADAHHARSVRIAQDAKERELLWSGRKGAFGAIGRISPEYYVVDGVVPRTKLPEVLEAIAEVGRQYDLRIANVFHAGDGNLHPLVLFDGAVPGELERTKEAGAEIMRICIRAGGVLSGEHGIGTEKAELMGELFSDHDMEVMLKLKAALDPEGLANPGKIFPTPGRCVEIPRKPLAGIGW